MSNKADKSDKTDSKPLRPTGRDGLHGSAAYGGEQVYGMPYGAPPPGGISISWILRVVRRKWLYIALGVVLGLAIAVFRNSRVTDRYRAQSTIEMSVRRPRIMNREDAVLSDRSGSWNAKEVFNTRLHKFRGEETRHAAFEVLQEKGVNNPERLAPASFSLVPETFLVRISCTHSNPEMAKLSANAYAKAAVEVMAEENEALSESAVAWLKTKAAAQKETLEQIEKRLSRFRRNHDLDLLNHKKKMVEETISSLNRELAKIQSRVLREEEVYESLKRFDIPDNWALADEMAGRMAQLRNAKREHENLLTRYRAEHPKVKTLRKKVQLLAEGLTNSFEKRRQSSEKKLGLYQKQKEQIESQIEAKQKEATELEQQIVDLNAELLSIERERQVADRSYQGILRRMEEARLSADEKTVAVKISRLAKMPLAPIGTGSRRALLAAIMMGGMFGVGLAFAKDWLENHVASVEDVEGDLGLKVVGLVPYQKSKDRKELAQATLNDIDRHQSFTEAFVGLRTNLAVGPYGEMSKSILVTSAGIECGKTVVACNMAATFANTGARTLLVDFDFRRPRLARMFEIEPTRKESLLHMLGRPEVNERDFESLPSATSDPNLFVISNYGDAEVKPSRLLGKDALERFMTWAKENYDQVILDSPPHGLLSDAIALSEHVDGVVIVCRHEKSRKKAILNTVKSLDHVDANILGAVINGAPRGRGLFSKYDYYYGGYSVREYEKKYMVGEESAQ